MAGVMSAERLAMFQHCVNGDKVPQFDESDLSSMDNWKTGRPYWYFTAAMVSTCAPLFDGLDSNHEVEDLLRKKKVIRKNNTTDSEYCQFFIYFSSVKSGMAFIERLNEYLLLRAVNLRMAKQEYSEKLRSI